MKTHWCAAIIVMLLTQTILQAKVVTEELTFAVGDTTLHAYIAYDDAQTGERPGVMVVHEWWGLNDYAKRRARQLAELGYVAMAVDMYGDGKVAQSRQEAGELAGQVRGNTTLMRERAQAGLAVLKNHKLVDAKRVVAMGYCFGGTVVLELAYSGADLAGVVSFHGGITAPTPEEAKNIKARVLVLHGAEDPFVSPESIHTFIERMTEGEVDWQFIAYGGAVHTFTNPEAGNNKASGAAYNEAADKRSWEHMKTFFAEILE